MTLPERSFVSLRASFVFGTEPARRFMALDPDGRAHFRHDFVSAMQVIHNGAVEVQRREAEAKKEAKRKEEEAERRRRRLKPVEVICNVQ